MQVGQAEDYAVRALVDLAAHPDARIREIAARTSIPDAHLAKVIQSLARAGIVETTRGRIGGVRLVRAADSLTVREVMEAVQGPLRLIRCPHRGRGCPRDPDCALYRLWSDLQSETVARLGTVRLSDLLGSCDPACG